jgi:predicted oxidoreductase
MRASRATPRDAEVDVVVVGFGAAGQVLRQEGSPIAGLCAAGRNAVGIASHSYISGLSISDCIFSGRTGGRCGERQ